jgi:hypothetical protein
VYYSITSASNKVVIYLFEKAGLSSYIMGCGIGSENVQECSFMHKFVLLTIL